MTGEHRSPRGCAIGLGVRVGKAQALVGDFLNIGSDEGTSISTHRDLCGTDLVPAQVIIINTMRLGCLSARQREEVKLPITKIKGCSLLIFIKD